MRTKYKLNAVMTKMGHRSAIEYTCPKCGERNKHFWFGREDHSCTKCEKVTNLKGATL